MNLVKGKWIDVSIPVCHGMVSWPSDPKVEISSHKSMSQGARCNVALLKMGSHTGTHMDAPRHFLRKGKTIDELSLESLIGLARVITIKDSQAIRAAELKKHDIRPGQRVLLKTKNSKKLWQKTNFAKDFVYLALDAAEYLAAQKIILVGIDYLSVGGHGADKDGILVHRALLRKNIAVVESLNLSSVASGLYDMICLPLRLKGGDGSPARVILRKRLQ